MEVKLNTDLWMEYWNLYDSACWSDYLSRPNIRDCKSQYILKGYLHDNILVPAIEQIESNIEKVDSKSKFLYWFRFREEFIIVTKSYRVDNSLDIDEKIKNRFREYNDLMKGFDKTLKFKIPEFEFFKWFPWFRVVDVFGFLQNCEVCKIQ